VNDSLRNLFTFLERELPNGPLSQCEEYQRLISDELRFVERHLDDSKDHSSPSQVERPVPGKTESILEHCRDIAHLREGLIQRIGSQRSEPASQNSPNPFFNLGLLSPAPQSQDDRLRNVDNVRDDERRNVDRRMLHMKSDRCKLERRWTDANTGPGNLRKADISEPREIAESPVGNASTFSYDASPVMVPDLGRSSSYRESISPGQHSRSPQNHTLPTSGQHSRSNRSPEFHSDIPPPPQLGRAPLTPTLPPNPKQQLMAMICGHRAIEKLSKSERCASDPIHRARASSCERIPVIVPPIITPPRQLSYTQTASASPASIQRTSSREVTPIKNKRLSESKRKITLVFSDLVFHFNEDL